MSTAPREHLWASTAPGSVDDVCMICETPAPAGAKGVDYPPGPCPGPRMRLPEAWPACGAGVSGRVCAGREYHFTGGFFRAGTCTTCGRPIDVPTVLIEGQPAPPPEGVVMPWGGSRP